MNYTLIEAFVPNLRQKEILDALKAVGAECHVSGPFIKESGVFEKVVSTVTFIENVGEQAK